MRACIITYRILDDGRQLILLAGIVIGQFRHPVDTVHQTDGAGQSAFFAALPDGRHSRSCCRCCSCCRRRRSGRRRSGRRR